MGKKALLFYITLFLLILAFSMTSSFFDFDLWARLIAGKGFIEGGHVLTSDFLSYTPVHTWWDHEWGAGVIFYLFFKFFGPYSLIILQALLMFGIFFTASKIIKLRTTINPYNILFYFFALMAVMPNLNNPIRCHLFSFLFFTIYIYILEKTRQGNKKLLFLIPIITLCWNNIHGGVVAGLGLMVMYAIGEFLNKKPFKKYLITLLASFAVLFINPWGYDYIKFLLMANTMKRPNIIEWWGLFSNYHLFKQITFKIFMFVMIIIEALQIKKENFEKVDKVKYFVLLSTLYLAIAHVKLLPFFAISSLCFVYEDFYKLIGNIKLPKWKDNVIFGFLLFISCFTFLTKDFSIPVGMNNYPIKEVEFVKINNIKGKILTNFGFGSYVSYKLYPNNLIFMDGRYEEVYFDYMVPLLKNFYLTTPNWYDIIKYFTPDVMIVENSYPVYNKLKNGNLWKVVYKGDKFGVFLPISNEKKDFLQPSDDIKYYKKTLFDTNIKFGENNE
jgi:hypothetical protein